jgi:transposase
VSLPTVDRWVSRFLEHGLDGLASRSHARVQVPEHMRRRAVELAMPASPVGSGLARWTARTLADYISGVDEVTVSGNYVTGVLREVGVRLSALPDQRTRRR